MSLLRLNNVSKSFDDHLVLRDVHFRLKARERVGLIGKNGTGKTTVLRLLLGQEQPTTGTVEIEPGTRLGYFSQFSELSANQDVGQILSTVFADIQAIEEELLEIEIALGDVPQGTALQRLLGRQTALFEEMGRREGWTYANRIDTALTRLGFSDVHRKCPVAELSGGWRNRAALAKILLEQPDVLLLDEPTNYLDIEGLDWLEDWLNGFGGAAIIVSHDRDFSEHVVTRIVEIENHHFQQYIGGFTDYVRQRQTRLKSLERQFVHEQELLTFEAEAIADRREALKNPSKALLRKLADVKKRAEPRPVDRIVTGIYRHLHVPSALLRVENLAKAYDDQVLFSGLAFEVHRGDRICVIGPNGCGKTTLLRVLTESEEPDDGRVVWHKGVHFVDYNRVFAELDPDDTLSHSLNVTRHAWLGGLSSRKETNRFLALMRFSEMDLRQRIGTLSGGQRARLALAKCLLSGASVVFLDEPTNHLDLTATQVMERALVCFPGAVVIASHDRFFIDKAATRLLVFQGDGVVREVAGNWTIWQASLGKGSAGG